MQRPNHSSPQFRSVHFSRSVLSDFLWCHESQHARPPCPSPTPRVHSNSCLSSQWCHPAISSCRPLLLLPPIPPSIRVFSNESTLRMRWPKYWSFSFSISPSKEHPGLISFRMDWLGIVYWLLTADDENLASFHDIPQPQCVCRHTHTHTHTYIFWLVFSGHIIITM